MVLTCHYSHFLESHKYILKFLWTGVFLFFVISGYVFGKLILTKTNNWRKYAIKRFYRIYPLYIVSLFCYYLISHTDQRRTIYFLKHLFFLNTTSSVKEAFYFNPAYWSLPVEVEFYILIPFLIFLRKKIGIKAIYICFFVSIIAKYMIAYYSDRSTDNIFNILNFHIIAMFPEFGIGILLYQFSSVKKNDSNIFLSVIFATGCMVIIACVSFFVSYGDEGIYNNILMRAFFTTFCSLGYAFIMFVALKRIECNRFYSNICYKIGMTSYGLYLFHNLIPKIFERLDISINGIKAYVLASACTLLIAVFLNKYVEMPFRNYGRTIADRQFSKTQPV